jgi:hypothetical protein
LTCDFAEEIRERDVKGKRKAKAKAIDQSFRLRLHLGLRQGGMGHPAQYLLKYWQFVVSPVVENSASGFLLYASPLFEKETHLLFTALS